MGSRQFVSAWGLGCHLSPPLESEGHTTTWGHTNQSDLCCLPDHDHIWVQAVATGYVWVHGPNGVRVCADVCGLCYLLAPWKSWPWWPVHWRPDFASCWLPQWESCPSRLAPIVWV